MFKRSHHQQIAQVLSCLNGPLFWQAQAMFGGGTAISLMLNEYRVSTGIDILCSGRDGYRLLREAVFHQGLQGLFAVPIKLEIVFEGRISLDAPSASVDPRLPGY